MELENITFKEIDYYPLELIENWENELNLMVKSIWCKPKNGFVKPKKRVLYGLV